MRTLQFVPNLQWFDQHYPNIKTLLFDMDGTLIDSEYLHAVCIAKLFQHLNLEINLTGQWDLQFKGQADVQTYQVLKEKYSLSLPLEEFLNLKNHYCVQLLSLCRQKRIQLYQDELIQLILDFKKRDLSVALVTASERAVMLECLKGFPTGLFNLTLARQDTERTKPHPDPYLLAMKQLKVCAEQTLIFEDSMTGLSSARESGAKFLRVDWFNQENFKLKGQLQELGELHL